MHDHSVLHKGYFHYILENKKKITLFINYFQFTITTDGVGERIKVDCLGVLGIGDIKKM